VLSLSLYSKSDLSKTFLSDLLPNNLPNNCFNQFIISPLKNKVDLFLHNLGVIKTHTLLGSFAKIEPMSDLLFYFLFTAFAIFVYLRKQHEEKHSKEKIEENRLYQERIEKLRKKVNSIILTTTDYVPNRNVRQIIGIVESSRYEKLADEAYTINIDTDAVIGITSTKVDTIDGLESFYVGTAVTLD
jgi:flagellar biosynthesis component FlhA